MKRPSPPITQGFTLIEVLIGTALLALLFGMVTLILSRSAQASRASTVSAQSNVSLTKLGDQLGSDLGSGQVILRAAGKSRLDLLRLGQKVPLTLAEGQSRMGASSLKVKGTALAALSGQNVVIVGSQGDYLITRVTTTPSGADTQAVFSCLVSVPGTLSVFPFTSLSLEEAGGLRRTEEGVSQLTQGVRTVTFEPVYGSATGIFAGSPMSPVPRHNGQRLSGVNYALTSAGEQPVTSVGTASLNLAAFMEIGCDANPAAPKNNLGKLQVNVLYQGGVAAPSGVTPAVGVSGPAMSELLSTWSKRTFENLDAGTYAVSTPSIVNGPRIYDAVVTGNPAEIGNGKQGTVNVNYLVRKGKINLQISGLPTPPPESGAVRFTGPDNVTTPAQNGTPTVELTPGDYSVTADPIGAYEAEISAPSLNVTSTTNQTVTVTYAIPKGSVRVIVSGLPTPPPASGLVRLTGPEPQNIPAESGSTDLSLRQGTYGVSADPVGDYEPSLSTSSVSVGKGSSSTITVSYAIPAAPLSVRVEGLPSGNSAPITVSGPEFVTLNVPSGSSVSANLAPGSYTVSAPNLTIGGTKYQPDPASATVSLGKGGASHVVTYVGVPGGNTGEDPKSPLSVRVEGLPAGNSAPITVSGPDSVTLNVPSGSAATANLAPGSYTVTAPPLTIGGTKYQPSPASAGVSLGESGASHLVTYTAVPGGNTGEQPKTGKATVYRVNEGTSSARLGYRRYQLIEGKLIPISEIIQIPAGEQVELEVRPDLFYALPSAWGVRDGACEQDPITGVITSCMDSADLEKVVGSIDGEIVANVEGLLVYRLREGGKSVIEFQPIGAPYRCYEGGNFQNPIPCPPSYGIDPQQP